MPSLRTSTASSLLNVAVGQAMHRGVVTCAPDARPAAIAATMASNAIHAVVVLSPEGGTALELTALDVVRAAVRGAAGSTAAELAREPMPSIGPAASLAHAVAMMGQRDMAHVLVTEPGASWPAGVLSSFDVVSVLAGRDPAVTRVIRPGPARPLVSARALSDTTVGAVMHPGVVTCPASAPLTELAGAMADMRVHCVAVAGAGRNGVDRFVWGLVSDMDVVHAANRGNAEIPAAEVAATAPLALPESAGLDRAAALMADHDASHVVALGRSGMPSGVVSTLDVLRIVAAG
jgi:CBS domain-containing protein